MNYFISAILRLFASLKLRASILTIISANMTARRKFTYPCMVYYRLHMKQWPPNSRLLVETENVCWTMFPVDLNAWFVIVKKKHPYYLFVLLHRSDTVCWSISHIVGCWFLNSFFKFLFWSFIRRLNLGIEPTRIKYISCRSFCYFCLWGIVHSTKWEIDHEFLNNIRRTTDMVAFFYISNENYLYNQRKKSCIRRQAITEFFRRHNRCWAERTRWDSLPPPNLKIRRMVFGQ